MTSTLSPAQIQERRDAARARWDKAKRSAIVAAGGTAGAAAAGTAAQGLLTAVRSRQIEQKRAALAPLRGAFQAHVARQAKINTRARNLVSGLRSNAKMPATAARIYDAKFRLAALANRALAAHQAVHSETYLDTTSGDIVQATDDLAGETKLINRVNAVNGHEASRFKQMATDLREKGKPPARVQRAGSIHIPKRPIHTRDIISGYVLSMSRTARGKLDEILESDAEQRAAGGSDLSVLHDLGIHSEEDLKQHFMALRPAERGLFGSYLQNELGLNRVRIVKPKRAIDARTGAKIVQAHTVRLQGYPNDAARQKIRAELLADIDAVRVARTLKEGQRAHAEIEAARPAAQAAGRMLQYLRPRARRGILGAGLIAGALIGAFTAARLSIPSKKSEFLQKISLDVHAESSPLLPASPPPQNAILAKVNQGDSENSSQNNPSLPVGSPPPDHPLLSAAQAVESDLAAGVGRALASWRDATTPESVGQLEEPGGLLDSLDGPLMDGMAPMDRATAAGLTAPARVQLPPSDDDGDDKGPKLLHFAFNITAADVRDYAKKYRYTRVREISNAQRANIRQIVAEAATAGSPPAAIARKIRDVVGLTAKQAQIVANYRQNLQASDPRSLTYSLRDKRFDRTVQAAIKEKTPLTPDQVDKMVEAYQRRFIAYRAMTIARTEAIRAANNGQVQSVRNVLKKNPGYTVAKTWIATMDDRTRHDHRDLHRKTVIGLDTPFVCDSGDELLWPHDPDGAADQVIRCRCTFMTTLIPRAAAARHGPAAYSNPTPSFWSGPRQPFDLTDPGDIFPSEFAPT